MNYEIVPTCNHYQTMLKSRTIMLTFLTTQLTFPLSGFRHQRKAKTTYNCVKIFTRPKTVANKKDYETRLTWNFYQTMQIVQVAKLKTLILFLKFILAG